MSSRGPPTVAEDELGNVVVNRMDTIFDQLHLADLYSDVKIRREVPVNDEALAFVPMVWTYTVDRESEYLAFVFDADPLQSVGSLMQIINYLKCKATDTYDWVVVTKFKNRTDLLFEEGLIVILIENCGVKVFH